ncbi:MAG: hypothetical protein AB1428_11995 [Bacteroidota bacterium]
MQRIPLIVLLGLLAAGASAQTDQYIVSRQGSISLTPVYQSWSAKDAGTSFSQSSMMLSAYVPFGRSLSFSFRTGGAGSAGDVPDLSGLTDVQAGLTYYWEAVNTVFTLGVNAPTGKRELSRDQFLTSVLFSNSLFNLQVPVLGQGINLNPGVAWVFPVSDRVVLGLAGAFQYRGPYKPREGLDDYDPGEEFTGSAGIDFRMTETISVSADFVLTAYTADKFAGEKVYASGNAYWTNLQYKQYFREDELLVFLGYRTKSKGQTAGAGGLVDEQERIEPGRLDVLMQYRQVFGTRFSLAYLLDGHVYEMTPAAYAGAKIAGAGLAPTLTLSSGLFVPARVKFQFGKLKGGETITGIEAGLGIGYAF